MIKPSNIETIRESFKVQASGFESPSMHFSNKTYLEHIVSAVSPSASDSVLEVAAGTCACGRALAPHVQMVACLDATPAMLEVGKAEAQGKRLDNMLFVKGYAEDLPFLNDSFDIVISRLAFHHFADIHGPFEEMVRILKPGGKFVLIDLEAAAEPLRKTEDEIATLREPSHVKNLSEAEVRQLFSGSALAIEQFERTSLKVSLDAWLELTKTPAPVRERIIDLMRNEMAGQDKTGFSPYQTAQGICFDHRWLLVIGAKPARG